MSQTEQDVFPNYVIPRLVDGKSDPLFYRSTKMIEKLGLDTPQPCFLGWFDLAQGKGCHFVAKVFLNKKWVLGRYLLEAPKDDFKAKFEQWTSEGKQVELSREEFDRAYNDWLSAAHAKGVIEWWLQD